MEDYLEKKYGILIVDDDEKIRLFLQKYLSAEGFHVDAVSNGAELRKRLPTNSFDLILLDVGLPGEDGFSLARRIRKESDVGIIMLTGRSDILDRVVGIELGADDYIAKPFHLREVLARIRAVLRRIKGESHNTFEHHSANNGATFEFGPWRLMIDQRRLEDERGHDVPLTSGEFDMLAALTRNAGRVLTRDQLIDMTKGPGWVALDRTIDAQIARLRKKIEPDTRHPVYIKSVRGVGYMFVARPRHN